MKFLLCLLMIFNTCKFELETDQILTLIYETFEKYRKKYTPTFSA